MDYIHLHCSMQHANKHKQNIHACSFILIYKPMYAPLFKKLYHTVGVYNGTTATEYCMQIEKMHLRGVMFLNKKRRRYRNNFNVINYIEVSMSSID